MKQTKLSLLLVIWTAWAIAMICCTQPFGGWWATLFYVSAMLGGVCYGALGILIYLEAA